MDYPALVETIVSSLVTKPEAVEITSETVDGVEKVMIHVAEEDTGRVIGRRGTTINAIRTLARVASVKSGDSVEVDVAETRNRPEGE